MSWPIIRSSAIYSCLSKQCSTFAQSFFKRKYIHKPLCCFVLFFARPVPYIDLSVGNWNAHTLYRPDPVKDKTNFGPANQKQKGVLR